MGRQLFFQLSNPSRPLLQKRLGLLLTILAVPLDRPKVQRRRLDDLPDRNPEGLQRGADDLSLHFQRRLGGQRSEQAQRLLDSALLFIGQTGLAQHPGEIDLNLWNRLRRRR